LKKLLLVSIRFKFSEGKWVCSYCKCSLRHYSPIDGYDTYWCPRCKTWRWIGYGIPGAPIRKTPQIEYLASDEKQNLMYMYKVMSKYEEEMIEKLNSEVVIYTNIQYTQEFLQSLIPNRKEKNENRTPTYLLKRFHGFSR
jgi:hypothetical protein